MEERKHHCPSSELRLKCDDPEELPSTYGTEAGVKLPMVFGSSKRIAWTYLNTALILSWDESEPFHCPAANSRDPRASWNQ